MYQIRFEAQPQILKVEAPESSINALEYVSLKHCGFVDIQCEREQESFRILSLLEKGRWKADRLEKNKLSANFQGNPLWPAKSLQGYDFLMKYFGLVGSYSEDLCVIPSTNTINSKILALHSAKGIETDRIFLFKETIDYSSDSIVGNRAYVDTFIDQRKLPMAPVEFRDSVHDWSYHFITLLFTDYLEAIRLSLSHIRASIPEDPNLYDYEWNYYGHQLNKKGEMQGCERTSKLTRKSAVYQQMAISLDVATAKIIQLLAIRKQGLLERCQSEVAAVELYMSGDAKAIVDRILWNDKDRSEFVSSFLSRPFPKIDQSAIEYILGALHSLNKTAEKLVSPELNRMRDRAFQRVFCGPCFAGR